MSRGIEFTDQIKVGLSIGNTLDAFNDKLPADCDPARIETCWGNPVITKEYVQAVLNAGFNIIRIPVSWRKNIGPAPEYKIREKWMARVKEVVDYAYDLGAFVILNVHHEDWNYPYYDNQEKACDEMVKVWTQIAETFADYDDRLIFEAQNEPRKIGTPVEWNGGDQEGWDVVNATNLAFLNTIRNCGGKNAERYLMIPGYGANCKVGIHHIDVPKDDKIIISVHAYEPYEFALEIPGRDTWNHDTEVIDKLMKELNELYISKGVPVIIGEFGAMEKHGNEAERAEWVAYYVKEARKIHVPCVWWDNALFQGGGELFGLFDRQNGKIAYPSVVKALMENA